MGMNNKNNNLSVPLCCESVFTGADAFAASDEPHTICPFETRHPCVAGLLICLPTAISAMVLGSLPSL